MQTFKAFFKILKKNSIGILIYLGIFILLAFMTTSSSTNDAPLNAFSASQVNFTVIDRDNSKLSKALISYLSEDNNFKAFEDNLDDIRNAMYYRDIYYALIIPKGFEADFTSGKTPKTESIKLMDTSFGFLLDRKIDGYFTTLRTYLANGMDLTTATQKTEEAFHDTVKVSLLEELEADEPTTDTSGLYNFYGILSYIFAGVLTSAICPILIIFRKKVLRNRITVSSQTFHSHNMQLVMSVVLFALVMVAVFNLVGFLLLHEYLTVDNFLLYIINTICFAIVSVGLAFLSGNLFQKNTSVQGFAVVVPLAISFLGGVFVPVSVLGDTMKSVAKCMPTYWYIEANDIISSQAGNFACKLSSMSESLLIQLLFAFALFCMGLVAAKKRRER